MICMHHVMFCMSGELLSAAGIDLLVINICSKTTLLSNEASKYLGPFLVTILFQNNNIKTVTRDF